jgi:hypothetical protein
VAQTARAKKTYFVAEEPSHLERLLQNRATEIARQMDEFKDILPRLASLRSAPMDAPEVRFYDSSDAVRVLFRDFITTYRGGATEILQLRNLDDLDGFMSAQGLAQVDLERRIKGISSRLLYTSKKGSAYPHRDVSASQISRFVSPGKYRIHGDIGILGNSALIISPVQSRLMGMTIRNVEMVRSLTAMFEMSWDFAETFS